VSFLLTGREIRAATKSQPDFREAGDDALEWSDVRDVAHNLTVGGGGSSWPQCQAVDALQPELEKDLICP